MTLMPFGTVGNYGKVRAANTVLWQLGTVNNSSSEFADFKTANPETLTVPADWSTRTNWTMMSKGLKRTLNPAMVVQFNLASVPVNGVQLSFKLLDSDKIGPEMAVYANSVMAGLIQLWGTDRTPITHDWKKTYQLYIPKEMLYSGANTIKLEAPRPLYAGSQIDPYLWFTWDYLKLEALESPAAEPVHGKLTYMGTTVKNSGGDFQVNDNILALAPYVWKWLGIAYSGNTIRADFWKDVASQQPRRLEYLQLLKSYNMSVMADHISPAHFDNNSDGTMPQSAKNDLQTFLNTYGSYIQYYELENEPGLSNGNGAGGNKAELINLADYFNSVKPAHIKTVAPGWDYGDNGYLNPPGWQQDPAQRLQIENLTQATNGHAYGASHTENNGSFVENLKTFSGVNDGWPKEYITSEMGTVDAHTDFWEAGSSQPHATAFDRIVRAHVAVADRFMQHASTFNVYSMFNAPNYSDLNALAAYPGYGSEDNRLKTYRRLALAYATHGRPLPYIYLNQPDIANKKVIFRAVDTSSLSPLPGSGATANKILLNFVNFEATQQTMQVRVTMPFTGATTAERFGPGNTYGSARSTAALHAWPTTDLTVTLGPGESVQYIVDRLPVPGKLEAESYNAMSGIQVSPTTDSGGGYHIGYVNPGDWMDYQVNVQTAGTYSLGFRVASMYANTQLQLRNSSGTVLGTVNIPNTGSWQTWQTVYTTVSLPAGAQTLRVYAATGEVNINWLDFQLGTRYKIVNAHTGKVLCVSGAGTGNGTNVWTWSWTGANNQQWLVADLGGGLSKLLDMNSGKSLNVAAAGTANGTNADIQTYSGTANQKWQLRSTGDGYYKIVDSNSQKVLDVYQGSPSDGANVQIWEDNENAWQKWQLVKLP
jgi:hypothetical protein